MKRIESGRDVEVVVGERQLFDFADANVGARTTAFGNFGKACGGVDPADLGAIGVALQDYMTFDRPRQSGK